MSSLEFDFPQMLWMGPLATALLIAWFMWRQRHLSRRHMVAMAALRGVALLLLSFLAAQPVCVVDRAVDKSRQHVAVLVDRSLSMSLEEDGQTRYTRVVNFLRERLFPGCQAAQIKIIPYLFDEVAESVDGPKIAGAKPLGKRTNLGGAIAQALESPGTMAVVALTDGAANIKTDNMRALSAMLDSHAPFIGIGFGSDKGVRSLSLRNVETPPVASPGAEFQVTAHLEAMNLDELPAFDLLLFRDGVFHARKTVQAGAGSRFWVESFIVKEEKEGTHTYEVRLQPPAVQGLTLVNPMASSSVRITTERELRVLYVQGALTWDYKFIGLALRGDPAIKITGLTRTSSKSLFRQNVENAGELLEGFPKTIEGIAPFRVVVLSNMRPTDLTTEQQELLARFCGELGGGILMIGGPETFDASWHSSRLEQLLPVVFADANGVLGMDRPFQMELTEEALANPVFQITSGGSQREAWHKLPKFQQYGRVDAAKPGAQVWALHQTDEGPKGRRILMASQRYGAGTTAIMTMQNFWVWRLSKDSDPEQFDRFWRQFLRYLAESSRQDVSIQIGDQELRPGSDINLTLEKEPNPKDAGTAVNTRFTVRVQTSEGTNVASGDVELAVGKPVNFTFRPEKAGLYTIGVFDNNKAMVATRVLEIRDVNLEYQDSARNMENLGQWASVSDGLALRAEECGDSIQFISQITKTIEKAQVSRKKRTPFGINTWTFMLALGCLCGEWIYRKRLDLI